MKSNDQFNKLKDLTQRAVSYPAGHSIGSNPVGPEGEAGGLVGGDGTVGVGGGTVGVGTEGGEPGKGRITVGSPLGSMHVSGIPS